MTPIRVIKYARNDGVVDFSKKKSSSKSINDVRTRVNITFDRMGHF